MNSSHLIFVGGCPRSGTTLIKRILDSHSDIFCGPEFGHLPELCKRYKLMKQGIKNNRLTVYTNNDDLRNRFSRFINSFFSHIQESHNVRYIAEKTPDNVLQFDQLNELFPDAKFIHVIRNPLDVAASYLKVGQRINRELPDDAPAKSVIHSSKKWMMALRNSSKNIELMNALGNRYLEIRFEDIINDSSTYARKITNFIGVDYQPSMIMTDRPLKGDSLEFTGEFYTKEEYIRGIDKNNTDKWIKVLSKEQVKSILSITKNEVVRLGYYTHSQINEMVSNNT